MNFSSLTNRIFLATALLAVLSIAAAVYIVNRAVTSQASDELQRNIDEAARLVDAHRQFTFTAFGRDARLIADLPVLKAAVDTHDPATVQRVAREYHALLENIDLFAIADNRGQILARLGASDVPDEALAAATSASTAGEGPDAFWPEGHGILMIKAVPIWIDPRQPDLLGTLILGSSLDSRQATRFKDVTNSEIAFGMNGQIKAATLAKDTWPTVATLLSKPGIPTRIRLNGEDFLASANPLGSPGTGSSAPMRIVLRSQTERLRFLSSLHTLLAGTAVVAVMVAVLLSYGIARTVTRPLGTVTSTMREMAKSGDLSRRIPIRESPWQDEDARLLTTTFNSMTDAIQRSQREATQRERLSSLGRLSTVVAHEIRNPLMIIKTSLRSLRREGVHPDQVRAAARDIDEEITRLNRIVAEVLDFARPIKFDLGPVDLNVLAEDAVHAAEAAAGCSGIRLTLDSELRTANLDAGRLRQALLNIIGNAIQAVGDAGPPVDGQSIRVRTARLDERRAAITVTDQGGGIAPEVLPRVFDPFFTTRRTGTGIGLAISRNIIEGLGGRIVIASDRDRGTEVRIELPLDAATA